MSARKTSGAGASGAEKVSRSDIESKLREIRTQVEGTAEAARPALFTTGAVGLVLLVVVVFLLGRRRGRSRTTVVEIRRV